MHKLDWRPAEEWVPHSHTPLFTTETTSADTLRIVAGVPDGSSSVLLQLVECLTPPFLVLYVLHTPRGEGNPGRYQGPELTLDALQTFIDRFSNFFAGDARFDLWVHSPGTNGTIVWDRHNLIFGYGPISCFRQSLGALGFSDGQPTVPSPHIHHYRKKFDEDAAALLSSYSWQYTPLRPEDEQ